MFHSEQAYHYTSNDLRRFLAAAAITQSMSRRVNRWDNAVVKRLRPNLKTERTRYQPYRDHVATEANIKENITIFYSHPRLHNAANN